jgi:hypothetical protein
MVGVTAYYASRAISDALIQYFAKGGKQRIRHSDMEHLTDQEVSDRAGDKSLDPQDRRRYQEEEKALKKRNERKGCGQ